MKRRFLNYGGIAALTLGLTATAWYGGNAAATGNQQPSTARVAVQTAPAHNDTARDDSFRASYSTIVEKVSPAVVTVRVAGKVTQSLGALGYGGYQVNDGTGTLTVVTDQGATPRAESEIGVEGEFRSAFTVGSHTAAVLLERRRFTK